MPAQCCPCIKAFSAHVIIWLMDDNDLSPVDINVDWVCMLTGYSGAETNIPGDSLAIRKLIPRYHLKLDIGD